MFRDKDQELERLAQALLDEDEEEYPEEDSPESEYDPEDEEYSEEEYEETWELSQTQVYRAYNADTTDTDLESFSEEVHRGRRKPSFLVFLVWLLTVSVALACMYLFMHYYGGWI